MIKKITENIKKTDTKVDSIFIENSEGNLDSYIFNDIELHELRSCSKILIAFAYGIALNENLKCKFTDDILSLNIKLYPTFSSIYKGQIPEQVKDWTIRTLLTHSTGYEKMMFNEKYVENLDKNNLLEVLFNTEIKYKTGEHFTYSNVEPYLLSIFFQENFGQNISDFVNERIFKPLDIKKYKWLNLGKYCAGATGLYLNHIDFHKIGQLLMNAGVYKGNQIIPAEWIKEMTSKQVECPDYYKPERVLPKFSAGYHTWISRDNIVFRDGSNGQYIICDYKNNRLITIMSSEKEMTKVTECLRNII